VFAFKEPVNIPMVLGIVMCIDEAGQAGYLTAA
jgi:hypothetical protein